jgi:hypothetical protein
MKRSLTWALGGLAFSLGVGVGVRSSRARARPHEELDANFHTAYDRMRVSSARAAPVLVLFDGSLVLMHGSRRDEFVASHPSTRILQAVAHAPVGVFAVLSELATGSPLGLAERTRLAQLRSACSRVSKACAGLDERDVEDVIERSLRFIDAELARGSADTSALARFASGVGPKLLALIDHATRLELEALHEATDKALASLDAAELRELEVVVAGAHQARTRSLGLQYFQKRFGEAAGEERRVAYAESAGSVDEARSLVGARRLDRAIARAFFGDPKRLQRDVLGDAAKRALERAEVR